MRKKREVIFTKGQHLSKSRSNHDLGEKTQVAMGTQRRGKRAASPTGRNPIELPRYESSCSFRSRRSSASQVGVGSKRRGKRAASPIGRNVSTAPSPRTPSQVKGNPLIACMLFPLFHQQDPLSSLKALKSARKSPVPTWGNPQHPLLKNPRRSGSSKHCRRRAQSANDGQIV